MAPLCSLSLFCVAMAVGAAGESTCGGSGNAGYQCSDQMDCYGESSCCFDSGGCDNSQGKICDLVNACGAPTCGDETAPETGFPAAEPGDQSLHNPSFDFDGCTCQYAGDCPTNPAQSGNQCWGELACGTGSCQEDGLCHGNKGTAPVTHFCREQGNSGNFVFCPTAPPPSTDAPTTDSPPTDSPPTGAPESMPPNAALAPSKGLDGLAGLSLHSHVSNFLSGGTAAPGVPSLVATGAAAAGLFAIASAALAYSRVSAHGPATRELVGAEEAQAVLVAE